MTHKEIRAKINSIEELEEVCLKELKVLHGQRSQIQRHICDHADAKFIGNDYKTGAKIYARCPTCDYLH